MFGFSAIGEFCLHSHILSGFGSEETVCFNGFISWEVGVCQVLEGIDDRLHNQ